MQIALFDFDGTITSKDSLIKFIRYVFGDVKTAWGLFRLSPILIFYKLKFISNVRAKQHVISYFFRGMDESEFKTVATEFSLKCIDTFLRPQAMAKIAWHKDQGHKVGVVSASIDYWLKPWCDKNGLDLIATKMEIKNRKVTGKFLTENCHGKEKATRVKETYHLSGYEHIYAYGDSDGDRELLDLAHTKKYRVF